MNGGNTTARIRRAKELSEIKHRFAWNDDSDPLDLNSKAAVVLAYANWEGFYNECTTAYWQFLVETGKKVKDTEWMLLLGAFHPDFESLRDKNLSSAARLKFFADLKFRLECGYDQVDPTVIEARSNLNFERVSFNYQLMSFDIAPLQRYRIRLDKELVGWRHSIAHGDAPDLSAVDIADHVEFTSQLLILVADSFQYAILARL